MASGESKLDATVIAYGDKVVAVPLTDQELQCYINDVENLKSNGQYYNRFRHDILQSLLHSSV